VGQVQKLKYRDTMPTLEVELHDPPPRGAQPGAIGPVRDLTGASAVWLHIHLSDGSKLSRAMEIVAPPTSGVVRYQWVAADWDAVGGGGATGGLVVGPTLPLAPGVREHRMEYEVIGGSSRLTFPNGGTSAGEAYDTLRIWADIGQGA